MDDAFREDSRIQQVAEAYALDAIDWAEKVFAINLDWSDESVRHVESMLTRLHDEMGTATPSEDQIFQFAKMLGSYVGEVYRKNHGAIWGIVTLGGQQFPGLEAKNGTRFWPWGRAQNRLKNGPEDNMWQYYQHLLSKGET